MRYSRIPSVITTPAGATLLVVLFLLFVRPGVVSGVGREFVPLGNWAYDAIERFEALGLCVVPNDRPLTRSEFGDVTSQITKNVYDRRLTPRDRYNLQRLEKEFTDFASQRDPQARYDPPTFYLEERPLVFESDLDLEPSFENVFFSGDNEGFLKSSPQIKLHLSDHVTYDARYRLLLGPEHGDRARDMKPSRREKSFKGLTSLYERSYLIAAWGKIHAFVGREYVDWGASEWGNLLVPGDRHSLDQAGARVTLKNLRLSWFYAQLSPYSSRYLAGHRVEVRFGRTVIGVNETVLFGGKAFDPVYAFPLSSFYANQFNERGDDNVMWSFDVKTSLANALTLYGGVLIDDFQFERDGKNPDKIAIDLGGRLALAFPVPATIRARYRYVDIFTYTHRNPVTAYVSGEGSIDSGDEFLGAELGPDADQARLECEFYPQKTIVVTAAVFAERRGEGNTRFRAHFRPENPYPTFPSGVVQKSLGGGIELVWELARNSRVSAHYSGVTVRNQGHVDGLDGDADAFRLAVSWDF